MSVLATEIRRGEYADSIVLMQLQAALAREPDVDDAGVVMATPANLELLKANGLLDDEASAAAPDDLVIVVRAASEEAGAAALGRVGELMRRRSEGGDDDFRPRSLSSAARLLPEADWVLVSVPGTYAGRVGREALAAGKHLFLYSDNVPIETEVELKRAAVERGLLVMGPDCGTAIVGGVGFGFANRVRRGSIGVVGASGTGIQAITTRIDALGGGISQAIGTGGRDLSAEVGGLTARQGLDLLSRDPETAAIVLVSKPPAPEVTVDLLARARRAGKPVIVLFLGWVAPARRDANLVYAANSTDAAMLAVEAARANGSHAASSQSTGHASPSGPRRYLRALLAGGTLAYETQIGLRGTLTPIHSNVPIAGARPLDDVTASVGHTVLDLGADELTVGRAHPMIDPDLRLRRLRQEAADPETGVVLLDVVLGQAAHLDPAAELAPAIQRAVGGGGPEVVVALVGTVSDRQQIDEQAERFRQAGATVFDDFAAALGHLAERLSPAPNPLPAAATNPLAPQIGGTATAADAVNALAPPTGSTSSADDAANALAPPIAPANALAPPIAAINIGLELFYDSLVEQGAAAVHVEWRPPAGGDSRFQAILDRLAGVEIG